MAYQPGGDDKEGCYRGTNSVPRQGADERTLHVGVTEGDIAQRIVTCGTPERARAVAAAFDGGVIEREVSSARGFLTLTGKCNGVPVSVVATGMGVAMMDFMVREVLAVLPEAAADGGGAQPPKRARTDGNGQPAATAARALIVRFGTCGSIREDVPAGAIVVCTPGSTMVRREPDAFEPSGSVRAGKAPYHVCDVVPSDAALSAALEAELKAGLGADGSVVGALNASGCSFYSSQGRRDPSFEDGHAKCDPVELVRAAHPSAASFEMETFHLLDVARCAKPHGRAMPAGAMPAGAVRASAASIVVAHRPSGEVASGAAVERLERVGGAAVLRALAATPLAPPPPAKPSLAAGAAPAAANAAVVKLPYAKLLLGADLTSEIEAAYGYNGLGLLVVTGVPGLLDARAALLPLGAAFASLPAPTREAHERPKAYYAIGWSHGKESLEGRPDLAKGSFYANPLHDAPFGNGNEAAIKSFPSYAHPNVWPSESLPSLEPAFKALGRLVVNVGRLVAQQCDAHVTSLLGPAAYPPNKLGEIVGDHRCCKARLLHYFPRGDANEAGAEVGAGAGDFSSWCGWHNDHGSLTGLVSAMYLDSRTGAPLAASPDPEAGLYIRDRHGALHHAAFGPDEIAFQIGEAAQIHSGGWLQATPHAVRGCAPTTSLGRYASRESFAVFMQPWAQASMAVPEGVDPDVAQAQAAIKALPGRVPPLASRWDNSMTFGEFTIKTIEKYY